MMMDFLGRVENLSQDYNFLCARLGIKGSRDVGRSNSSLPAELPLLSNHGIEVVRELYRQDVQLLDYSFEDSRIEREP